MSRRTDYSRVYRLEGIQDAGVKGVASKLKQLGVPDTGVAYLRITTHANTIRSFQVVLPTKNIPVAEVNLDGKFLTAVGAPEYGVTNLKVSMRDGQLVGLKRILGEESVDLRKIE